MILPLESRNEILQSDHSNKSYGTVLLHGTVCLEAFYKLKFWIVLEFFTWATSESEKNQSHDTPAELVSVRLYAGVSELDSQVWPQMLVSTSFLSVGN